MIITEKQLLILFDTIKESLRTHDCASLFSYNWETRKRIVDQIIAQQSDKLVDVK